MEIALKNDFGQTVKNLQNAIFKYTYDDNGKIIFTLIEGKIAQKLGITVEKLNMNELKHDLSKADNKRITHYLIRRFTRKSRSI